MINSEIGRQIFHNESELINSSDHEAITNLGICFWVCLSKVSDFNKKKLLERRWGNISQGNEAIVQYIKSKESNCDGLQAMARQQVTDYNTFLLKQYDQPFSLKKYE